MKRLTLVHLAPNHKGLVVEITGGQNIKDRFMGMGVYKNREIVKISHIGLRGPVVIKIGRSILALGHGMAEKVIVEVK
jgi:ferrous iron transport protein A